MESVQRAVRAQKGLLGDVLGERAVAGEVIGEAPRVCLGPADERLEGAKVSGLSLTDGLRFRLSHSSPPRPPRCTDSSGAMRSSPTGRARAAFGSVPGPAATHDCRARRPWT